MLFGFGFGRCLSWVEWHNAHLLLANSISTYRPVCMGRELGISSRSFIVTEKLTGHCMTSFISEHWPGMDDSQRTSIVVGLSGLIRSLHASGINMPDLYIWHIFIEFDRDGGVPIFSLIDLHRTTSGSVSRRDRVRNLAALFFSIPHEYFDDRHREIFLEGYCHGLFCSGRSLSSFRRAIDRRVAVLRNRRGTAASLWPRYT